MAGSDALKDYVNEMYDTVTYYTASLSPFSQGVEIRQPFQLSAFINLKIRGNISLGRTLNNVAQTQNFFNDLLTFENVGIVNAGSHVTLDTPGQLGAYVSHETETRDLGISTLFNNSDPFEEADSFWNNPSAIITTPAVSLVIPTSLVQVCASPSSFDGVIEPFDIRRIVDRTSIELPYVSHSIKGSMSIVNSKRESIILSDCRDLRNSSTVPFLDSVETFGNVDQPGAFSDLDQRLAPYSDTADMAEFYSSGSLDEGMRANMISGFTSASIVYSAPRPNDVRTSEVFATHGFDFSQNDNYRYDSIAFGGLLK